MELLNLIGEGAQIGDMNAEDVAALSGRQAFSLLLPDGRVVVLIGLTSEEARGCLPGFMAPARFTVSAAGCLTRSSAARLRRWWTGRTRLRQVRCNAQFGWCRSEVNHGVVRVLDLCRRLRVGGCLAVFQRAQRPDLSCQDGQRKSDSAPAGIRWLSAGAA